MILSTFYGSIIHNTKPAFLSNLNHKQVLKFGLQQKTLVATMRRFSVMKKDSSVTRDIKLQAENLRQRLEALAKQVQNAEEQQGPAAVSTRIQRSQHAALYRKFQQVGRNSRKYPHKDTCVLLFLHKLCKEETSI